MKSVELAHEMPADVLLKLEAYVAQNGPLTLSQASRAVRDAAILEDLAKRPGQYVAVSERWGVSSDTVRDIEAAEKKIQRTV